MVESGQSSASSPVPRAASASQLQRRGVAARDERTRPDGQSEPAHQDLAGTGSLPQPAIDERLLLAIYNARSAAERGEESLAEAARAAGRDALTGLPTRTILMDRLLQAMAHCRRCHKRAAVLLLDLDQFKRVNTRLGHAAGDTVLRHLAAGLAGAVRAEDTVSRHGGDEFLVLLPEIDGLAEAELIAATLLMAASKSVLVGDQAVTLRASIGISMFPDDGDDASTLIEHADCALHYAKQHSPGRFAWYGAEPAATLPAPPAAIADIRARRLAEQADRNAQLREANASLVKAALGAESLHLAARAANERQGGVLSMVAHELRNPLTPIRMAAGLLERAQPGTAGQVREIIEQEVAHMTRLIDDLLDVSRANTGKLRLERTRVDLEKVITAAIGACAPAMDLRRQRLVVELPEPMPQLDGDPIRLGQVVRNLLDNAAKYTPDGGRIVLSVGQSADVVEIAVTDDGIGISAQTLPSVFNAFVQDDHAVGFNGSGLGIGLTLVRELVQAHGGTVTASSAGTGCGSRFLVRLPRADRDQPPLLQGHAVPPA